MSSAIGDLEECFPEELRDDALPYFIDWLVENVHLVEITAYSDDDAYTIFETMNDRGLSLSPTDMLKGYLLAEHRRPGQAQQRPTSVGKTASPTLNEAGKEVEADCFKAWLRSQYATKIRERKRGAQARGLRPHRHRVPPLAPRCAVRRSVSDMRTTSTASSTVTSTSTAASTCAWSRPRTSLVAGLEHVRYNADHGFTLQLNQYPGVSQADTPDEEKFGELPVTGQPHLTCTFARRRRSADG